MTDPETLTFPTGWLDWPVQRHAVAQAFRAPTLYEAAPHLVGKSDRKDLYLFRAFTDVIGRYPDYPAQEIGDCTSQGSARSGDLTQCLEIRLGDQEEFQEICTEAVYGLGREIANMLGSRFDGCFGTAVGQALTQFGAVSREELGPYSGQRAKLWGRRGVPDTVKQSARNHPFRDATLVTTLEELDAALDNGYVGFVGSDQGFSMTRDEEGVCRPRGRWMHLMALGWGRKTIRGDVHYLIAQSWGPNVPGGPTPDGIPNFCFWAHETVVARMIAQRDAVVLSGFQGFPARSLPEAWSYHDAAF